MLSARRSYANSLGKEKLFPEALLIIDDVIEKGENSGFTFIFVCFSQESVFWGPWHFLFAISILS